MIRTLYKIGTVLQQNDKYAEYFYPWKNPFPNNTDNARVIVFDIVNGIINPTPVIEAFSANFSKYLYREAPANATNLVPTFLYISHHEEKEVLKKIKKIKSSIENYQHTFTTPQEVDALLPILKDPEKLPLHKDQRYLITFTLNGIYFGELDEYRNLFYKEAYNKYYFHQSKGESLGKNMHCSVTYQLCPEVYGFVDTLGFTVGGESFNRNGFNPNNSYTMFPVSPEAVRVLDGVKTFVTSKMAKNFYGLKYFILPRFIQGKSDDIEYAVSKFVAVSLNPLQEQSNTKSIIGAENILSEIVEDETLSKKSIYYDIFFYAVNKAQFLIKLHLSDILPSRLRRIYDLKKQIENLYFDITAIPVKKNSSELIQPNIISLATIKNYFSTKSRTDTIFHPAFYKIVEAIFYGTPLDENFIVTAFLKQLQFDFKNRNTKDHEYDLGNNTKQTFLLYQFFSYLNLFNRHAMDTSMPPNESVKLTPDAFIAQHPHFFDSEYKKGVFLLGCLTEKLLYKQRKKLSNEPFTKHLNNLSLDKSDIAKIFPKLINKLREYDVYYTADLESKIGNALVKPCNLSKTDISYAFTLGLVMQKEFDKAYYNNNPNNDETQTDNNNPQTSLF